MPEVSNLTADLAHLAATRGWDDRPAFLVGDDVVTHGQAHQGTARVAGRLRAEGVGVGDRVLVALPDGIEFVWAFLATMRLGALAVPVNARLTESDHRYLSSDSGAVLVICEPELTPRFGVPVLTPTDIADAARTGDPVDAVPVGASAPGYAHYTSGTTGPPKCAVHRQSDPAVFYEAFAVGAVGIRPDDVLLSISKMYFAYGTGNSMWFPLFSGAAAIIDPRPPTVEVVTELAERHRPTVLFSVPTMYANLATNAPAEPFSSVRVAISAGEVLTPALADRAEAWLGVPILDGLGSTEVGQGFTSNLVGARKPGTIGRVLPPYEVRACDDEGDPVAPDAPGVLWVRGPSLFVEYLGKPEETAATLVGDGWMRTGDRVAIDAEGYITHMGRVDDLEMVGGITVTPYEIEDVLSSHPGVREAAVAAVRDDSGASKLRAFIVRSAGSTLEDDTLTDELTALARARLAPFKVPRSFTYLESLPRTPTGKLQRFALRAGVAG